MTNRSKYQPTFPTGGRKPLSYEWRYPKLSPDMIRQGWKPSEWDLIVKIAKAHKPWIEYDRRCDAGSARKVPKPTDPTPDEILKESLGDPDDLEPGLERGDLVLYQVRILQAANDLVKYWGWYFVPIPDREWRWHKESLVEEGTPLPQVRMNATDPLFVP